MKKIFSIMLFSLVVIAAASAQQVEKLFDKYMEDERFNYIYRKGNTTSFVNRAEMEGLETGGLNLLVNSFRNKDLEKMLILDTKDEKLQKNFLSEVDKALEADRYENTSYVRNGKSNRVSEYIRKSSGKQETVNVIKNSGGNILVKWERYTEKEK